MKKITQTLAQGLVVLLIGGLAAQPVGAVDTLNYTAGDSATAITIEDANAAADGQDHIASDGAGGTVDLVGIAILNLWSGSGPETVILNALDPNTALRSIRLDGDNGAGTDTGDDTFLITPSPVATVTVDGGAHVAGDTLIVDALGAVGADTGTEVRVSGYMTITYTDIETVTLLNLAPGTIVIEKATIPAGGAEFAFTDTITSPYGFDLAGGGSRVFTDVVPGDYVVVEDVSPGFDLTALACPDPDGGSSTNVGARQAVLDLDSGETISCTFTNTQRSRITVLKDVASVDPTAGDVGFGFTASFADPFTLKDGQLLVSDWLAPNASYTVSEGISPDWILSATCSDGSAPEDIGLSPGEWVTCTFTNTQRSTVVAQKYYDTDLDGERNEGEGGLVGWPIFLKYPSGLGVLGSTDLSGTLAFPHLTPGLIYTVGEHLPEHWGSSWPGGGVKGETQVCTPTGVLAPGEVITLPFGNYELAKLTVIKEVIGPDPGYTWPFDVGGPDAAQFGLGAGGQELLEDLTPGAYALTETLQGKYRATIQCTDGACGQDSVAVDLEPGEHVTCTATNAILPDGEAANAQGLAMEGYRSDQEVHAVGSGFPPDTEVDVYVTPDGCWVCCEVIAEHGVIVSQTVHTDGEGRLAGLVWPAPLVVGEYDLIFDVNRDGRYTPPIDTADALWCKLGFYVADGLSPVGGVSYPAGAWASSVPWVLATAAVGVLMAIFWRRRR